jgi:hypothetical protein
MKKLILILGCIAAMTSIVSCSADDVSDSNSLNQKTNKQFSRIGIDSTQINAKIIDTIGGGGKGTHL